MWSFLDVPAISYSTWDQSVVLHDTACWHNNPRGLTTRAMMTMHTIRRPRSGLQGTFAAPTPRLSVWFGEQDA